MRAVPVKSSSTTIGKQKQAKAEKQPRLRINLSSMDEAVATLADDAEQGKGFSVFTLNLDHLVKLRFDDAFRKAYEQVKYVTADGWPVAWLARRKGVKIGRTTGADMVMPLCAEAARRDIPIYLFGSSDDSLNKASRYLRMHNPGLKIAGIEAPPYGFDPSSKEATEAAERIHKSGARLCFVALGAPKQELFADHAQRNFDGVGFLCIGAALDFLAGHQERAPMIMRKTGTEWLYRLLANPRRMAGRYASSALIFAEIIVRQILGRQDAKLDFSVRDLRK